MTVTVQARRNTQEQKYEFVSTDNRPLEDVNAEVNRMNNQLGWRKYRVVNGPVK